MRRSRKLKKSETSSKLVLEEIIGLTVKNSNGLASNAATSVCAYLAGCVVVVYNVESAAQSHLVVSHRTPKPLSCVALSHDARFIAAGESGNQPAVLLWDCSNLSFISELKGHLYGVECIAFSPNGKYLVSVGGYIHLWDWKSRVMVSKLKASSSSSSITSVSFSADSKFILTAGKKHLKVWKLGTLSRNGLNNKGGSLSLHGKPINLGPQHGCSFVSVASILSTNNESYCGGPAGALFPIFALTDGGVLCLIDSRFSIKKSVDIQVEKGLALSASNKLIACACSKGIVKLFASESLDYAGSVLYSLANGSEEIDKSMNNGVSAKNFASMLPDAIACQFSVSEKLVVIYGDRTLYIWNIQDLNKVTKHGVLVSHSACIWDVVNLCCENMHDPSLACVARGCCGGVSFATCSEDGSIRSWDLALQFDFTEENSVDTEPVSSRHLVSAGIFERDNMEAAEGFRSLAASTDGKYLVAGDCNGNLHIYDLQTSDYTCLQNVHDSEILSTSFSLTNNDTSDGVDGGYLLASAGRDQIIYIYDANRNFDLIGNIDDHSAAVTSVKFIDNGCGILSCSADRSLVFRDISMTNNSCKILCRHQQMTHGTVYDMAVDPATKFVVTTGQDKKINVFEIASGKLARSLKQDKDFGEPIKVTLDPSCSYLAVSYSNKYMCMYDYITGELVARATGHGEVITGFIFLPDCKHLVSVGGDGCIFMWKLPAVVSTRMHQKMEENFSSLQVKEFSLPVDFSQAIVSESEDHQGRIIYDDDAFLSENLNKDEDLLPYEGMFPHRRSFRFSISRLPRWAQSKVACSGAAINPGFIQSWEQGQAENCADSRVLDDGGDAVSSYPEGQTPLSNEVERNSSLGSLSPCSLDTEHGQSSPPPQGTVSVFSRDKKWRHIYTVCLDVLNNSPEVQQHRTELKMPVSSSNILKDVTEIPNSARCSSEQSRMGSFQALATASKEYASYNTYTSEMCDDKFGRQHTSTCNMATPNPEVDEFQLHRNASQINNDVEGDLCHSQNEDSDLFKRYFHNLSTISKGKRSESSVRRRYSARYVIRRDHHEGCKRLFDDKPSQEGGVQIFKNPENAGLPVNTSETFGVKILEVMQEQQSCRQELKKSIQSESTKCSALGDSLEPKEAMNRNQGNSAGSNLRRSVAACREALLSLDTTAENAFSLFSEVETLLSNEGANWYTDALYNEAAELLPSIAEKLATVSELVQRSKVNRKVED